MALPPLSGVIQTLSPSTTLVTVPMMPAGFAGPAACATAVNRARAPTTSFIT